MFGYPQRACSYLSIHHHHRHHLLQQSFQCNRKSLKHPPKPLSPILNSNTSKNLYLYKSKVFSNSKPVHQNFNTRALTISPNIFYHHKIHPQHEKTFLWKPHTIVPNIIFHHYKIKPQNHNL